MKFELSANKALSPEARRYLQDLVEIDGGENAPSPEVIVMDEITTFLGFLGTLDQLYVFLGVKEDNNSAT